MKFDGNHAPNVVARAIERELDAAMAQFDALPFAHRCAVRCAPYNIDVEGLEHWPVGTVREALRLIMRASVLATYGADHPQAGR